MNGKRREIPVIIILTVQHIATHLKTSGVFVVEFKLQEMNYNFET